VNGDIHSLLAIADPQGAAYRLAPLLKDRDNLGFDAIAIVGDLASQDGDRSEDYRSLFEALGSSGVRAFWVPGPADAPVETYLRESRNLEVVFTNLRGVHGSLSLQKHVLVAGMGGEIDDDPDASRDEQSRLRYPGWEVEYRLKPIDDLDKYEQRVFLFSTPPAHKGLGEPGSEVLAELVNTYRPRVVVAAGAAQHSELLGKSLVVCPGSLMAGEYALIDIRKQKVTAGTLERSVR
jgi:Icc-related predicted phosphoesterase